jgi:2-oxoisovalerate dehydrogenase E2 component (dihydrolipoyl transacylase)
MSTKITMPMLGEGMHEGTIGKWLKQPGETVEQYEAVVEIVTDKVNTEIPAPIEGVLTTILAQEGDTVEVGAVIAEMQEVGAAVAATQSPEFRVQSSESRVNPQSSIEDEPTGSFPAGRAVAGWYEEKSILDEMEDDTPEVATFNGNGKHDDGRPHRYTPVVRRIAQEHHLDLDRLNIQGSGLGGRITRDDLLNYLEQQRTGQAAPAPQVATPIQPHKPEPVISVPAGQGFQPIVTAAMQVPLGQGQPTETRSPEFRVPNPEFRIQSAESRVQGQPKDSALSTQHSEPATSQSSVPTVPDNRQSSIVNRQSNGPAFTADMFAGGGDEIVALTPMRKAIADHMARSKQQTPHAWTIVEVDVTNLVQLRARSKEEFKRREGIDLTYLPFVMRAVVEGLRQFPQLNATWSPEKGGIVVKRELNLGVAIDVPDGLIVPVIHRAEEKSFTGLARALNDVISRARDKKLQLSDVQGGTFTVNNPGSFGSVLSYPIINQPQAGIITMEAIVKRPVVVTDAYGNDSISIRSMMNMCLSFDHRVVDGAYAGRFLQFIKNWLQNPKTD